MEPAIPSVKEEIIEESSSIEYSETLLPNRILAGAIDMIVAVVLMGVLAVILPDILSMISNAVFIAYLLFKDSLPFLGGQSIGKKATKIQAVTEAGEPLTKNLKEGIIRNISAAIPIFAVVEVIILNSREKADNAGLRLGDDFAKTKVISLKEPETLSEEEV